MTKPVRISTPCDKALRQALRNRPAIDHERPNPFTGEQKRQESLRSIAKKTGVPFNTLSGYGRDGGKAVKDGVEYKTHLTLEQAEALARHFGMRLMLEAVP